ncbi:hypothetical protein [Xanthomonas phaseoli]|uniref:hypothetical protein n=1 Tax=Xanthomonas phaseoli TaxID=1985254 RepID=UPI001ADC7FB4|nr:hypothetical protein [Xanthomonas phaseoli]MBO9831261.1 hypothetical protein [Xanthomonas phaseoli pv. dieffenbachiae]MBO9837596.1 hypothetical protein [Xanthomonas phaseoli pv. dieffenbachiae]MBO9839164.1 hypothetical protein [Xanthomonas phaseoli pv. dieffenbachiae]MBO9861231.1 hypothetical protein [Xanthomonas phaseoli pv. dieffenbachiae]MBO9865107.1 hypothetical protein [Xanthomonas phaseoli pv. dieffenbachiae]
MTASAYGLQYYACTAGVSCSLTRRLEQMPLTPPQLQALVLEPWQRVEDDDATRLL